MTDYQTTTIRAGLQLPQYNNCDEGDDHADFGYADEYSDDGDE